MDIQITLSILDLRNVKNICIYMYVRIQSNQQDNMCCVLRVIILLFIEVYLKKAAKEYISWELIMVQSITELSNGCMG
jgi:hypothetical protein